MKLTPVFIDLETFWSPEHSLTKMNPIVYCTHPETEIISCAVKVGSDYTGVSFGEDEIKKRLRAYDWSDKIVIGHNMSGFDAMILAWRCGVRPAMWGCTLAMARPHHAKTTGLSLGKLVAHYKLGAKDQTALINTRGRHLKDFTEAEIEAMREYNRADTDQCAALFEKLLPLTSKREMQLIDSTIRMLVAPRFRLDIPLLEQALEAERARKKEALHTLATALCGECTRDDEAAAEQVRAMLASSPKFAYFLQTRGVRPPMKISPATGKETYALSKTDEGFIALTEHEDELVALAANTRLGVKSTILESRLETFLAVGAATGGRMPIPINYYGADTTGRDSGCLVADTLITVFDPDQGAQVKKRIVDVLPSDLVWDGDEFVAHEGVVCHGAAEVIEWDGVKGTADHEVFTETGSCGLFEAMQAGVPIKTCRAPTSNDVDAARAYIRNHQVADSLPL